MRLDKIPVSLAAYKDLFFIIIILAPGTLGVWAIMASEDDWILECNINMKVVKK